MTATSASSFRSFDDPSAVAGTEDERLAGFRRVRDEIRDRLRQWLETV